MTANSASVQGNQFKHTQEVKNERFLMWTLQNNAHFQHVALFKGNACRKFALFCLVHVKKRSFLISCVSL